MIENICPFMSKPIHGKEMDGAYFTELFEVECREDKCMAWNRSIGYCKLIHALER